MARIGQGRSGGYRVLIAWRAGRRSVCLFGFAKNETDNIDRHQLASLRQIAAGWLAADAAAIARALEDGALQEVVDGEESERIG